MTEREINGYLLRATTEPEEAGAPFYEPAFRIRRVGQSYEHPHVCYATSQNIESRNQQEALAIAERELQDIKSVIWNGAADDWDLS